MDHISSVGSKVGRRQQLRMLLLSGGLTEENLNAALLQAATKGHKHILHLLIDAGATNLAGAMTCASWSGHIHVVDALILRTRPIPFGAAFVGALVGLRKDVIDRVLQVADTEGLNRCLQMGAARIWSCSTVQEVEFLLNAIESLVDAGARNFQRAMQVSCGDAVIEYWNDHIFKDKAKILERIVVLGSHHLTANFFGRILLMICVTFHCKIIKHQDRSCDLLHAEATSCQRGEHVNSTILDCVMGGNSPGKIVEEMITILAIVCRNGAADLVSSRLLELADSTVEDIRSLLEITACQHQHLRLRGGCPICKAEWPLKMMRFLLVKCGIRNLSVTVMFLPVFQAARLNVLLPVVQCFLEHKCFNAYYIYLDMAITFCQGEAIQYLLNVLPRPLDVDSIVSAVRAAASNTRGPPRGPEGVLFALHANFLDDPKATVVEATLLLELAGTDVVVKRRLRDEWSQQAFEAGADAAQQHFLNWMLVRKRSRSCLRVGELPWELQVAIGYLPLYKNCVGTPGELLSQRQRGELISSLCYLYQGSSQVSEAALLGADKISLLGLLAARMPACCCEVIRANNSGTVSGFFTTQ